MEKDAALDQKLLVLVSNTEWNMNNFSIIIHQYYPSDLKNWQFYGQFETTDC